MVLITNNDNFIIIIIVSGANGCNHGGVLNTYVVLFQKNPPSLQSTIYYSLPVPGKDVLPPQCIGQCIVLYCIAVVLRREKVLPILIASLKSGAIVLQYIGKIP
jgi:hypothetical protein